MSRSADQQLTVDSHGLRLPREHDLADATHDVVIEGHRVWSFSPARDLTHTRRGWLVPWPKALQPMLKGSGEVVVREHVSGRVVLRTEVSFGGEGVLRVASADGTPMAVDKGGRLTRMFAEGSSPFVGELADQVVRLLDFLNDEVGITAYLSYGALLGAVRNGHFIGHDNDADIGVLSAHEHPVDIMRESFELERVLQRAGWRTRRLSGDDFKAMAEVRDGSSIGIDVFGSFYLDGLFHLLPGVRGELPRESLLPLGSVELEGRTVTAPHRPEAMLELLYGPGWRVPDPAHKALAPRSTKRRYVGWFRGERDQLRWWNEQLRAQDREQQGREPGPSPFAAWVAPQLHEDARVYDVGAGGGHDTAFFAGRGHVVEALDYAPVALGILRQVSRRQAPGAVDVRLLNLYELRQVLATGGVGAHRPGERAVYARELLGTLKDDGRHNLWILARMLLRAGGHMYLEFGVNGRDEHDPFVLRQYRQMSQTRVAEEIAASGGTVELLEIGTASRASSRRGGRTCRLTARWT